METICVIVPVYNVESYLHRCIDSILAQTHTDFELILIDDGTPDNCGAICDAYAKKDARIHVIHQENGGLSAARNTGIDWAFSNSNSQWITFIDSDDWVHKQYLELLYAAAKEFNVNISSIGSFDTDGSASMPDRSHSPARLLTPMDIINATGGVCAPRKLYAKSLWEKTRFPIGKTHEDEYTIPYILFSQKYIADIDEKMYYYFVRANSIMHGIWSIKRLDIIDAKEAQLNYYRTNNFREQYDITYRGYLYILSNCFDQIKLYDPTQKKQLLSFLRKKIRYTLKYHFPSPKPTHHTYPHVFEIAYPISMFLYWTGLGFLSKFHKK